MSAWPTLDLGTAVRIRAEVRDANGTLTDPASITCQILKPDGTTYQAATSMTASSVGVWLYDKQTSESDTSGDYQVIIRSTSNSLTTLLKSNGFRLA